MSESIKMKGRVLLFDRVDNLRIMFPKNCNITYPEIIPIIWNFEFNNLDSVLGNATISKYEDGLICDAIISNPIIREILDTENGELHIGGFYKKIKEHHHNGVRMIDQAHLVAIGVTLAPALDELKLVLEESEE